MSLLSVHLEDIKIKKKRKNCYNLNSIQECSEVSWEALLTLRFFSDRGSKLTGMKIPWSLQRIILKNYIFFLQK